MSRQGTKEILKRIYEHQFLLIDHVAEYFKTKAEAWKRVREMEKAGLVCRESLFTFGAKSAIRVTRIGEEVALNSNAHLTPQAKKVDQGTAEHDAFVASVRQRLEHHWPGGRWIPERFLKQDQWNIIPDGIYTRADGKQIRIEVENSYKGRDRIRFLVRKLRDSFEKFDLLLYVATTSSIYDRLIQCFIGFEQIPIAVIKWDDLRSNPDPTVWSAKRMRYIFPQPIAPKEEDNTQEVSR